ncbi:unnamed protein product [Ambrosiozyma monospora]|uniref:Unnamed protein product n=1 Tax=Ambrosiozyma monospora TaxID=43982 RepID=A0A9W6YRJ1_AMBMO|nr:unnamed protein product [Ambrosiozyma monospora]
MDRLFRSRRSTVYSTKGIISSTQPLANAAGIKILEKGGNAVDACIAVAAALAVTEPASTGIGGDCFALYYSAKEKKVLGLNGTGRSASKMSIDWLKKNHPQHIMPNLRFKSESVFKVTVPGAVAGWCDALGKWGSGKVTLADCLQPSIELSETGFPLSQCSADIWQGEVERLLQMNEKNDDLKLFLTGKDWSAPKTGDVIINKPFAETLKKIAKDGKDGFYSGEIAQSIVKELNKRGHPMTTQDLSNHTSTFVEPISYSFLDHKLWEIPPNGSGIVALLTLGLIDSLNRNGTIDLKSMEHNSVEYLHLIIECLKISFRDSDQAVSDYEYFKKKFETDFHSDAKQLLSSKKYFDSRSSLFHTDHAITNKEMKEGVPNDMFKSDTVYFTATDSEGNACSFINSVYHGFGSCIIVPDHGFALHNRGAQLMKKNCMQRMV